MKSSGRAGTAHRRWNTIEQLHQKSDGDNWIDAVAERLFADAPQLRQRIGFLLGGGVPRDRIVDFEDAVLCLRIKSSETKRGIDTEPFAFGDARPSGVAGLNGNCDLI